jgi:hypothetical protein
MKIENKLDIVSKKVELFSKSRSFVHWIKLFYNPQNQLQITNHKLLITIHQLPQSY